MSPQFLARFLPIIICAWGLIHIVLGILFKYKNGLDFFIIFLCLGIIGVTVGIILLIKFNKD